VVPSSRRFALLVNMTDAADRPPVERALVACRPADIAC